ncbi:hypothetical protein PR202_gb19276 [Eleusine coracana subsp. coracana]|uniref:PGG domain-containing protein n=1 Tax=Eleusine coracana subsp. coracana TaxID=191504 RepID=A0AAV5F5K4_ELECO|nr:hypothetical protein PR202_gb19276 [Eleusine coracana subsp. coracana]
MDQLGTTAGGPRRTGAAAGPTGRDPSRWARTEQLGGQRLEVSNTLLVVAALITTLTYQLGTSIPGGYWQESQYNKDGKLLHQTGDPIMRDLHRPRFILLSHPWLGRGQYSYQLEYWLFMAASWVGFAGSMVMTLSLLARMAVDSRHVRWSVAVAYSSLVLTLIVSQSRTHLSIDILIWAAVVAFLWVIVSLRPDRRERAIQALCCGARDK